MKGVTDTALSAIFFLSANKKTVISVIMQRKGNAEIEEIHFQSQINLYGKKIVFIHPAQQPQNQIKITENVDK